MDYVLITGASSGIGYELAKIYANKSRSMVLVARRLDRLENIKKELLNISPNNINIELIQLDLSNYLNCLELYKIINSKKITIETLINNAGIGMYGNFLEMDEEKEINMIDLNIKSLTILTKLFLKDMIKMEKGNILNVSSIAAFQAGPLMSVYYASKAYVLSFTEAIRNEYKNYNVNISVLCPGPTDTEFEKSANLSNSKLFERYKVMSAKDVAKIAYNKLQKRKSIIIPGKLNKIAVFLSKISPRSLTVIISRKIQERKSEEL